MDLGLFKPSYHCLLLIQCWVRSLYLLVSLGNDMWNNCGSCLLFLPCSHGVDCSLAGWAFEQVKDPTKDWTSSVAEDSYVVLTWLSLPLKALGSSPPGPTKLPVQSCHWIVVFDCSVDKTWQMACFLMDLSSSIGIWLDASIMNLTVLLQEVWVDGGTFYSIASITVGEQSTMIWASYYEWLNWKHRNQMHFVQLGPNGTWGKLGHSSNSRASSFFGYKSECLERILTHTCEP